MNEFIAHVRTAMHQPSKTMPGRTLLASCLRYEMLGGVFAEYGYDSGTEKRGRSTLYFALSELADTDLHSELAAPSDLRALSIAVIQSLYQIHAAVIRISSMTSTDKLRGLNDLLDMPPVDMTLLVNDWLAKDIQPGHNKVLVHRAQRKCLSLAVPSISADNLKWTNLVDCGPALSLREQFLQVATALAAIAELDRVEEPLNSEGFPGPVAGFGGH